MAEWLNAPHSKCGRLGDWSRGFESPPLRHGISVKVSDPERHGVPADATERPYIALNQIVANHPVRKALVRVRCLGSPLNHR